MRVFAGETSQALALSLAFAAENLKNLPLALRADEKTWAGLVGKFRFPIDSPVVSKRFSCFGFFVFEI